MTDDPPSPDKMKRCGDCNSRDVVAIVRVDALRGKRMCSDCLHEYGNGRWW